eukprot:6927934-Alexandrium_andersonii.AAC.1
MERFIPPQVNSRVSGSDSRHESNERLYDWAFAWLWRWNLGERGWVNLQMQLGKSCQTTYATQDKTR